MSKILMFPIRLLLSPIAFLIFFVFEYFKTLSKMSKDGCFTFLFILFFLSWNFYIIFSAILAFVGTLSYVFTGDTSLTVWEDD